MKFMGHELQEFNYDFTGPAGCCGIGLAKDDQGFFVVGWEWKPQEVFVSPHRYADIEGAREMANNLFKTLRPI